MAHLEIRYFPILVIIPRLFFGWEFYDLVSGFYGLFLELVSYGLLFKIRPGPYMETNGVYAALPPPDSLFYSLMSYFYFDKMSQFKPN